MPKKLTQQEFIDRSNSVHGGLYDYSMVEYITTRLKVKIYCKKHDVLFEQVAQTHFIGKTGCKQCINYIKEQTCLNKHGVVNPSQLKEVKEKKIQTCLNNHGVVNPSQVKEVKEKKIQTYFNKYGVVNPSQAKEVKEKKIQTCLNNHGVEHPGQADKIKEKAIHTCLKNHGVVNYNQKHISKKSLILLNNKKWLMYQHHHNERTLNRIGEELGVNGSTVGNYFKNHNIEIKNFMFSMGEKEVLEYITSILPQKSTIQENSRTIIKPFELDIYIPEYQLAIEYNGDYWHSSTDVRKKDALKKYMCEKQGIQLLTICEHRWLNNQQLVKSGLRTILKKYVKNKNNQ